MRIKKGDTVQVLAGNDKGKIGEVVEAIPKKAKLVVKGVNVRKKHLKAKSAKEEGGIKEIEFAIPYAKVNLYCDKCKKAVKFAVKVDGDKKVRICKKCGKEL